jgi:hypothetical protein
VDRWLYRLLGIDPGQETLRADRVFFVQPWPVWAAVLAAAALAAWVFFFYHRDGRRPSWGWKGLMALLRLGAMALLLFMIWQPMLRSHRVEVTPSVVALLIDESKSMGIRDRWRNEARKADLVRALGDPKQTEAARSEALGRLLNQKDAALLRALLAKHSVRVYRFGDRVRGAELRGVNGRERGRDRGTERQGETEGLPLKAPGAAAEQSRIGDAIEYVLQDTAGQSLSGLVLLSDGGQNMGDDPALAARQAAQARAPIYTVGFGDPTPPKDVAVATLLTDDVVRKGDDVVVSIGLRQRGFPGRTLPVTVKLGGRVVQQRSVPLPAEGKTGEISLTYTPTTPGAHTLTVSVPGQNGELTVSNNQKSWPVRVVDRKLRILYIEGQPRWEFRFLKNAILRDPTTQFACILTDADPSLGGEGNVPIFGFPKDRKVLFTYDILVLGDVPREFFTPSDLKNIRAYVEERGGSLVTIAGENAMPWQYRGTDLEAVWPIVVPATRREILFEQPFQVALTDAGAHDPMLFFDPNPELNRRIWNSLPGMYWCGVADRVKPGATVLAEHPTQTGSEGKIPLMAIERAGEGTSFMSMVDSTWQWRFRVGDTYFYQFWGQVIRSLMPHELPGQNQLVRLTADRATYKLGERVVLRARVLTPTFQPVRLPQLSAELRRPDGQRFPVALEPVPGAAGVYSGEWLPPRAGAYAATVASGKAKASTNLVVEPSGLELEEPQQHEALLRQIAAISGGKYLLLSEAAGLPSLLPDRRQEFRSRVERELWDAPLPLILFVGLVVLEWILRKRKGLL